MIAVTEIRILILIEVEAFQTQNNYLFKTNKLATWMSRRNVFGSFKTTYQPTHRSIPFNNIDKFTSANKYFIALCSALNFGRTSVSNEDFF